MGTHSSPPLSESRGEPTDHNWCIWGRTFPVRTLIDLGNCNNLTIKAIEKAMFLYVYSLSCSSKRKNKLQKVEGKGLSIQQCELWLHISPFLSLPFCAFFHVEMMETSKSKQPISLDLDLILLESSNRPHAVFLAKYISDAVRKDIFHPLWQFIRKRSFYLGLFYVLMHGLI